MPVPNEPVQAEPMLLLSEAARAELTSVSQDAELIANGYEPIAVNGKATVAKGWNTRPSTIEAVAAERAAHSGAASTGLRTGRLVGVDIDIIPAEHVQAIKSLVVECLGFTLLERVGAKGAMLCYRNESPVTKVTISGKHPRQPGKIEIFGSGQQFVSYGIHPDTGKPYTWTNASLDGEPLRTPFDKLPAVTPDKLHTFADQAAALLRGLGYTNVKISGRSEVAERMHLDAPVNLEFDTPVNIARARTWLRGLVDLGDVAVEGEEGDSQTSSCVQPTGSWADGRSCVGGAAGTRRLERTLRAAMGAWRPRRQGAQRLQIREELARRARCPLFPGEMPQLEAVGATTSTLADKLVERFRGRWPDEYEALPELSFRDDDKTLPRCPDGCIALVYGEFGAHKTNTVLAMVLDAVLGENPRVCYAAGEGAHGVGKHRIPAHCRARGIPTRDLRGRLRIVPAVPLFASADQVTAFIEAQRDLNPDIVVLDSLATAIGGEDENSSKAAAFLTANGPAGLIRD